MKRRSVWVVETRTRRSKKWEYFTSVGKRIDAFDQKLSAEADEYTPPENYYRVVRYDASK